MEEPEDTNILCKKHTDFEVQSALSEGLCPICLATYIEQLHAKVAIARAQIEDALKGAKE